MCKLHFVTHARQNSKLRMISQRTRAHATCLAFLRSLSTSSTAVPLCLRQFGCIIDYCSCTRVYIGLGRSIYPSDDEDQRKWPWGQSVSFTWSQGFLSDFFYTLSMTSWVAPARQQRIAFSYYGSIRACMKCVWMRVNFGVLAMFSWCVYHSGVYKSLISSG